MSGWITGRLLALRTWALVRLGIWRGQWRKGRITVSTVPLAGWPFAGQTWRYGLYAPGGLADDEAAPLIVVLHGCKQRALSFAQAAGLTQLADRARARLLCPQQRRLANPSLCWNWFGPLVQSGAGELRVITAMLDDAAARVRVAPGSVSAIGLSAGGALAALLAFHAPERFGAICAVAAAPLLGSLSLQDPRDVMRRGLPFRPSLALGLRQRGCAPLAILHGTADAVVNPLCAEQLQAQALESLRRAGIELARHEVAPSAATTVVDYRADGNLRLRRIDVSGLGHEWSGGAGGHPYCARGGVPLAALCAQFIRDAGALPRP